MRIIDNPVSRIRYQDLEPGDTFTYGAGIFPNDLAMKTSCGRAVYLGTGKMTDLFTPTKTVCNVNRVEVRPIGRDTENADG